MKRSLAHGAGYLVIDHTDSPGLTAAEVAGVPGAQVVPAGRLLERDVLNCSHCQRAVVLEPGRVRARGYCPTCNHYLCDQCERIRAISGACVPFAGVLDRVDGLLHRHLGQPDHPALIEFTLDTPPPLSLVVPA